MGQLYIKALLIHWHTGLKFSSENRNLKYPKSAERIGPFILKNRRLFLNFDFWLIIYLKYNFILYADERSVHFQQVVRLILPAELMHFSNYS